MNLLTHKRGVHIKTRKEGFLEYALGIIEDNERFGKHEQLIVTRAHIHNLDDLVMCFVIMPKHIKNYVKWFETNYNDELEQIWGENHLKIVEYRHLTKGYADA